MSTTTGAATEQQPAATVPEAFHATPNAERYVLLADALRRRQLRAALLYGSSRNWRRRQRAWPAVVAGVILVAVIVGGIAVASAFQRQSDLNLKQELERRGGAPAGG